MDICETVDFFHRADPIPSSFRAKCRRWGVVYIYGQGETPDLGDENPNLTLPAAGAGGGGGADPVGGRAHANSRRALRVITGYWPCDTPVEESNIHRLTPSPALTPSPGPIMRRAALGIGFLAVVAFVIYDAWRNNAFGNAPLKWKATVDEYELVHHITKDSIYCAANVSAIWGSISSLCRVERESGKVLWRRKKSSDGDIWEHEYPLCWNTDLCFASSHSFDRKTRKTSNTRITAISLQSGTVLWEVPVSEEVRSLALGESLYCITNDGRFTTHHPKTGATVAELDLQALAGPRASYGTIKLVASIAIVGSNLSHDYTNWKHAKIFLLSLKTNRLIEELPKGQLVEGKYITAEKELQSFDLSTDEPKGKPMNVSERSFPMAASDDSGAVWTLMTDRGWQMLGDDAKPIGSEFTQRDRLMHVTKDALYLWDYRTLRSVDRSKGATLWAVQTEGIVDHVRASAVHVVVRCRGDTLYCFDTATGTLQWKYHLNDKMGPAPLCDGGDVIVSEKGKLLHFAR